MERKERERRRNEERRQQALLSVRSGASRILGLVPIIFLLPCLF